MTNFHRYIISFEHFVVVRQAIVEDPGRRHLNLARFRPHQKRNVKRFIVSIKPFPIPIRFLEFGVLRAELPPDLRLIFQCELGADSFSFFQQFKSTFVSSSEKRKNCFKAFVLKNNFSHNF